MKKSKNPQSTNLVKTAILGVGVTNATKEDILEYMVSKFQRANSKLQIVTPNPEIIVYANKHPQFKILVNQAQISLPDGVGVLLAGLFLGKPFKERITGVDFMEYLCKESIIRGWTVGLLGAKPGVALAASECLKKKYTGLRVSFAMSELSEDSIKDHILRSKDEKDKRSLHNTKYILPNTDLLFVAYGFPKQEEWIADHLPALPVRLAMGVGGAFDYISGDIRRAPFIVRSVGLEWLYRLIRQPWRIKRQLALLQFLWLICMANMELSADST